MKTYEELMKLLDDVHIEYDYTPVKYQPQHSVIHPGESRTLLNHTHYSSEPKNILGTVDRSILRMLCYDAK